MNLTKSFDFPFYNDITDKEESINLTFRYIRHWDELNFEDYHEVTALNVDAMMRFLWSLLVKKDREKIEAIKIEWSDGNKREPYKLLGLFISDLPWGMWQIIIELRHFTREKAIEMVTRAKTGVYGELDPKKKVQS